MKKLLVFALTCLLASSALAPASAGKKTKPVATTLYFHGHSPAGEPDALDGALGGALTGTGYATMDTVQPEGSVPKSMTVASYVAGPNTSCAGSPIAPVWIGTIAGRITGDVKVTFDAISTPSGAVNVQLFPDQRAFACDLESPAEVQVELPPGPGKVEAVIKNVNLPLAGALMVQISPILESPTYSRVLYDSTEYASSIEFRCIPPKGAKSCA